MTIIQSYGGSYELLPAQITILERPKNIARKFAAVAAAYFALGESEDLSDGFGHLVIPVKINGMLSPTWTLVVTTFTGAYQLHELILMRGTEDERTQYIRYVAGSTIQEILTLDNPAGEIEAPFAGNQLEVIRDGLC